MNLIGITGAAGSGKSTMAGLLVNEHRYTRLRFADTIKRMTMALLVEAGIGHSVAVEMVDGFAKNDAIPFLGCKTPRHIMQTLGTEWGRKLIDPDIWISILNHQIEPLNRTQYVVIDDVRFENEAAMIRKRGGRIIGIEGRGGIAGGHESEAGVAPDMTYYNVPGADLDDMRKWLRYIINV